MRPIKEVTSRLILMEVLALVKLSKDPKRRSLAFIMLWSRGESHYRRGGRDEHNDIETLAVLPIYKGVDFVNAKMFFGKLSLEE